MSKLRLWNGRWRDRSHVFVAAYTRIGAARLLAEADKRGTPAAFDREIRDYFFECWGNSMNGITPEVGVWVQERANSNDTPKRVI